MWMTQEVIEVVFAFLGINSNQGAKQSMNYHLKLKVFNSKGVLAPPFLTFVLPMLGICLWLLKLTKLQEVVLLDKADS